MDVRELAHFDHFVGFEGEVGMIHSIAQYFEHFGIKAGTIGLEFAFLTQFLLGMLLQSHTKPEKIVAKD